LLNRHKLQSIKTERILMREENNPRRLMTNKDKGKGQGTTQDKEMSQQQRKGARQKEMSH
ncbi:unnamed protein product, partial [Musa acuminata subsp. malaccensis]